MSKSLSSIFTAFRIEGRVRGKVGFFLAVTTTHLPCNSPRKIMDEIIENIRCVFKQMRVNQEKLVQYVQ